MAESLSRKVARNSAYSALGYFISVAILFFLTPYVISKLGAQMYGAWVLISALTGYVGLTDVGIGLSFQKFVAEYYARGDSDAINKIVTCGLAFYAALAAVLIGSSLLFVDPLLTLFAVPASLLQVSRTVLFITILNLALGNAFSVISSILNGMQLIDVTKKIEIATVTLRVLLYLAALEGGTGIVGLALAETALLFINVACNFIYLRRVFPGLRLIPRRRDFDIFRTLFSYGGKLQVSRIADLVNFQLDRLIVSRYVGLEYVVFADVGGRLLSRLRILPLILLSTLVPAVSELQALNQPEKIRLAFERSSKILAVCAIPLFVFVAAFAHLIMRVWFDPSYAMAAFTMQILALGYLLNVMTASISFFAQGMGDLRPQMRTAVIQASLNLILSLAFVALIGYYGAMIGTTLSLIIGAIYFVLAFTRILSSTLLNILRASALPLAASVLGALVALLPWMADGFAVRGRIVEGGFLLLGVVIFLAVYLAVLRGRRYFDRWDAQFILRISPRLRLLSRLIVPDSGTAE